jgi:hypothetical protein
MPWQSLLLPQMIWTALMHSNHSFCILDDAGCSHPLAALLPCRLKDIDASIRSLKTAELPNRLDPDQLKALLASSAAAAPQAQPSQQQLQA